MTSSELGKAILNPEFDLETIITESQLSNQKYDCVIWMCETSEFFEVKNGIKQLGSILNSDGIGILTIYANKEGSQDSRLLTSTVLVSCISQLQDFNIMDLEFTNEIIGTKDYSLFRLVFQKKMTDGETEGSVPSGHIFHEYAMKKCSIIKEYKHLIRNLNNHIEYLDSVISNSNNRSLFSLVFRRLVSVLKSRFPNFANFARTCLSRSKKLIKN